MDETLLERKVASAKDAQKIELEAKDAGVYVVQLEAYDRIGRRQQVSVDFFVGGDTPVTFQRAPSATATDHARQGKICARRNRDAARAIAVPERARARRSSSSRAAVYDYQFFDIANGFGRYALTLKKEQMPKLAVHFLIMRGRLKDSAPNRSRELRSGQARHHRRDQMDRGDAGQEHRHGEARGARKRRGPAQEVEVDAAARRRRRQAARGRSDLLDGRSGGAVARQGAPARSAAEFHRRRAKRRWRRATRATWPSASSRWRKFPAATAALEEWGAENNISVRKNFTPVPIYLPSVKVGADGVAKIKVKLPDTLTVFKLRAKAVSGADRFGFAGGEMLIRQELVAQPALPRFVRPGDTLDLGLVARVVEGPGGARHGELSRRRALNA